MKRVISIVEDEKDINNLVAQYLRKEGYEVHSYYTYEEASAHVADDDVHLWILDIMLDDKSGFDLIEEIRLQGPETPVIYADNVEIELTTKEFDLLMMFIKNKGIAFSRDKILENVWDENYFGSDRVVDDTLRRLRKKLPNLNIHTIYGYGYRLG